jgi:hypothetical protein
MAVENIGFVCPDNGGGATFNRTSVTPLTVGQLDVVANCAAGGSDVNEFQIEWELATPAVVTANTGTSLLEQSLNPDNYVVNTFIVVDPQ